MVLLLEKPTSVNRRNFFSNLLRTAAAITVASSMEVFGYVEPKILSFEEKLAQIVAALEKEILDEWEARSFEDRIV